MVLKEEEVEEVEEVEMGEGHGHRKREFSSETSSWVVYGEIFHLM